MRQNAHRARFFGDLVVYLDVKASRRQYGAEQADLRSRPLQARWGHASANKSCRKTVRGGRDPQVKNGQVPLRTTIGIFTVRLRCHPSSMTRPHESSLVAWVDDEPAMLVSYYPTHPLRRWGVVDERKTETADMVSRYQTHYL